LSGRRMMVGRTVAASRPACLVGRHDGRGVALRDGGREDLARRDSSKGASSRSSLSRRFPSIATVLIIGRSVTRDDERPAPRLELDVLEEPEATTRWKASLSCPAVSVSPRGMPAIAQDGRGLDALGPDHGHPKLKSCAGRDGRPREEYDEKHRRRPKCLPHAGRGARRRCSYHPARPVVTARFGLVTGNRASCQNLDGRGPAGGSGMGDVGRREPARGHGRHHESRSRFSLTMNDNPRTLSDVIHGPTLCFRRGVRDGMWPFLGGFRARQGQSRSFDSAKTISMFPSPAPPPSSP
jgi:hypothetical protein